MEWFIKRECYVVVHPAEWKAFAAMCDAAGVKWGAKGCAISEYTPALIERGRPVRMVAAYLGSAFVGLNWSSVDSPKTSDVPTIGFRRLKPATEIVDKAVITAHGREITARLISGKHTTKMAIATCSPEDTFRFGPGAVLAMFRALQTEEDRMLAMDLIGEERIRQLEPEIPNVRDLVGKAKKRRTSSDAAEIAGMLAQALSEAFGVAVEMVAGKPQRGKSALYLDLVAPAVDAKEAGKR